jgi:hypothetical protein
MRTATTSFAGVISNSRSPRVYVARGVMPESNVRTRAPAMPAMTAGIPKIATTRQSARRPTNPMRNRLFARCTTAVEAIATGTGKKSAKTGIRRVPSPNPE